MAARDRVALSLLVYVIAALLLAPSMGNHGLWLALLISFVARGITLERAAKGLTDLTKSPSIL
ncbi:MAG: hypothetical protein ACNA7M_06120 [Roseovarius sp.]